SGEKESTHELDEILKQIPEKTTYVGDTETRVKARLLSIISNNKSVKEISAGDKAIFVFDKTVFYGESGGQVGDRGRIQGASSSFLVEDTTRRENYFLHRGILEKGTISVGETLELVYENAERDETRKNHSATHLLQKALRTILGDHIKQAGSLVTPEKLRFDFNHFSAVKENELEAVEDAVNESILKNLKVEISEMKKTEADKLGAMAFFGDKYGDTVRVVDMAGHSVELCGGSHVRSTGEIGFFRILGESSSASGIRRIEATTGRHALRLARQETKTLRELASRLQTPETALVERMDTLLAEKKELEKKIGALAESGLADELKALPRMTLGKVQFLYGELKNAPVEPLRTALERMKNEEASLVTFITNISDGKMIFLSGVSKDRTAPIKAGDLVKKAAELTGGAGGGRADFAQAGGKDLAALSKVRPALEALLGA
ncbi:MAG: alanine--tRNA ligase, partial [Spirochaetia bacterium]|nr:alanine--tRNA ligase [Spirochaetia bacterium]